ncbi:MAG: FAD-binding protein [Thaumarchaeota archaeon]|nr:FAD-binding protein [Nitrososphaerota archaeon]
MDKKQKRRPASRQRQGRRLLDELAGISGAQNVVTSGSPKIKDYSEDMAGHSAVPAIVVRPGSETEVMNVVALADTMRVPLVPRGAGSSLTGASVLKDAIIVDLRRMNRVIKIDTVNWYVRVQAGITLEELNKNLEREGFFFPPDPASSSICTVGGAIAEGSGGLRCVRYGTVKDWVMALRVVLPNGKATSFGEPLAKNRAGFDLVHLMVGSEGTLGIVTEAWLKIIPIPTAKAKRLLLTFDDWRAASSAICELRASKIMPYIFEFLDKDTIKALNEKLQMRQDEAEATLIVDIEEPSLKTALEIFNRNRPLKIRIAKDEEEAETFYQVRSMAYLAVRGLATAVQVEDIVVPIDRLGDYLMKVKEVASKYRLRIPVNGHAGDGNVHPVILYDKGDGKSEAAALGAFEEICRYGISIGGSITGEHGVGSQKAKLLREQLLAHDGEEALRLMKEIKSIFDPHGIMNPGKYVEAA